MIGGRDKIVHALDPRTGERKWQWNSGRAARLVAGDRGRSDLPRLETRAVARTRQGDRESRYGSSIPVRRSWPSPAVASKRLVIGSLDGILYCFG